MPQTIEPLSLEYTVDADDRITWVCDGWDAFAEANGAAALAGCHVVGKELWDYICGAEVQHLYGVMLERVRAAGHPAEVTMNCDAPDLKRLLSLRLDAEPNGVVRFHSQTIDTAKRPPVALLAPQPIEGDWMLEMCSFCKRAFVDPKGWVDVEIAAETLGLFVRERMPRLTHGVCPDCHGEFLRRLRRV